MLQNLDATVYEEDGRIIPFCAMNTIYRAKVEKEFSVPIKDWRKGESSEPYRLN